MKGLLLKDFYALTKQMKIFLVIIVIFALMPGMSVSGFAIVYSAMLPITALAYDEQSKWDSLAAMMPYSAREIVLSKYVLGYISVVAAAVLSTVAQMVVAIFKVSPIGAEEFLAMLMLLCVALLMLAVCLPFMFKMGVEKGRLVFFAVIAAIVVAVIAVGERLAAGLSAADGSALLPLTAGAVAAAVILNAASVALSVRFYKAKAF